MSDLPRALAAELAHAGPLVELSLEWGCDGYDGCGVSENFIYLTPEQWDTLVAGVARERALEAELYV